MAQIFVVGREINTKWVTTVVCVVARKYPITFKCFGLFSGIGRAQIETMICWVANVISRIGTRIRDNIALHRVLAGIKSGGCACAKDKIGSEFPFLIQLILTDNIEIVFSIEAIGVPIAIVDSGHLAFGPSESIAHPACEFSIVFLNVYFHSVGTTDSAQKICF